MKNEWGEWRQHVLIELKRLNASQEKLQEQFAYQREEIAVIKSKTQMLAAFMGLAGGSSVHLFRALKTWLS